MQENTRIDKISKKKEKYLLDYEMKKLLKQKFIDFGKRIYKTKEGKQFFLLAKELFIKPNEKARDTNITEPLILSRLMGEDYICRNLISKFINNEEELFDYGE